MKPDFARWPAACLALLALAAIPAVAAADDDRALATADELVAMSPADPAPRFARARLLYRRGDFAGAERDYRHLVAAYPDDVDYHLGLAQTHAATGNDAAALVLLARATELAPDYEAVWQLRHRLLLRSPQPGGAAELETLRTAAAARFPASRWWREPPAPRHRHWFLQLGFGRDLLSDGQPDWDSRFLRLAYSTPTGDRYALGATRSGRFDRSDHDLSLAADWQLGADWRAGIAAHTAPAARFLPERQYSLHAGRDLARGWNVDVSLKRRRYATATADSATVLTEKYFGDFRAAWSVAMTRLDAAGTSTGNTLFLNWYPRPGLGLGVAWTEGREAEAVDTGTVLETDVSGVTLTGRHGLRQRWTIDWWLGTHEQGDFYRRRYAGLALAVEF